MAKDYGVDAPRVTSYEALELMVHHLELAAMYYEAIPVDEDTNLAECEQLLKRRCVSALYTAPSVFGMRAWLAEMNRVFRDEIEHNEEGLT